MVENQMSRGEITWVDILKMLAKKAKLIAWITLLALVLGAAAGVGVAMVSNATYGTQVEFYISSEERNSYILSLISSDSFSEKLLLDENGLPETDKGSNAYNEALAAKVLPSMIVAANGMFAANDTGILETLEALFGEDNTEACKKMLKTSGADIA